MTQCDCIEPGFCERHQCVKTAHWHKLCRTRPDYFRLWEEGRGPGQGLLEPEAGDGPSLARRAANFGRAVVRHAADGWRMVEEEVLEQRLAVCRSCPSCDTARMVCREKSCGCFVHVKARWRSEGCPLGKWPPLSADAADENADGPREDVSHSPRMPVLVPPLQLRPLTATVAIVSHNYGRFLPEAIQSVLGQSRRAEEVLVVDDASADDTAAIAARFTGVRYLRVENRNVHATRRDALAAASGDVICFLDADNKLPARYLEEGLKRFEPGVGVVYCDLQRFGLDAQRTNFPDKVDGDDLARQNCIDAGALLLRQALVVSDAFRGEIDTSRTFEDWVLARRLAADRWRMVKQSEPLLYRVHEQQASGRIRSLPHFEQAGLAHEDLTLCIPLSGRLAIWQDELSQWLERQTWEHAQVRLLLADSSQDAEFGQAVWEWASRSDYRDVRIIQLAVEEAGLSNRDRRLGDTESRVQTACCKLYNRLTARIETPFTLVIEDDILPPDDVIERLLKSMRPDVASVSAPYESRFHRGYVAWERDGRIVPPGRGIVEVRGTGFGCLLIRSALLRAWPFHVRNRWYDPDFWDCGVPGDMKRLLDRDCECRHLGESFLVRS